MEFYVDKVLYTARPEGKRTPNEEVVYDALEKLGISIHRADHDAADMGGTLRLGAYPCVIAPDSRAYEIYGTENISERHRHRYEMDVTWREKFEAAGMKISGLSPDGKLPEIVEIPSHPFFVAGQFHPEFQSSPYTGHPMFNAFIAAAAKNHK